MIYFENTRNFFERHTHRVANIVDGLRHRFCISSAYVCDSLVLLSDGMRFSLKTCICYFVVDVPLSLLSLLLALCIAHSTCTCIVPH